MVKLNVPLDVGIINNFREVIKDHVVFNDMLNNNSVIYNKTTSIIDRVRDLVYYFSSDRMIIDLDNHKGFDVNPFILGDWVMYGESFSRYVYFLFKVFGYSDEFVDDLLIFENSSLGLNNSPTDSKFIKYLRALMVAHPDGTDRYKNEFQHNKEFAPYVDRVGRSAMIIASSKSSDSDVKYRNDTYSLDSSFAIRVDGDDDVSKLIFIHPDEIKIFIQSKYNQIENLSSLIMKEKAGD